MKRSERYYLRSRHNYFMALTVAAIGVAIACWTPSMGMIEEIGTFMVFLMVSLALIVLALSISLFCDAYRFARMSREEAQWEYNRAVRHNTESQL